MSMEHTHFRLSIMDADGGMIELIEQYPVEDRVRG